MQSLEVSGAVRPIYGSLDVKRLIYVMLQDVVMLAKPTGRIDMQGKIILKHVLKSYALGLDFII